MKFIISFIAVVVLSVATAAFAQEETSSPTPEESPSATPEEKASATVEEKSSTASTPMATSTPSAMKESSAMEKKEATTAASPAKAAASPAAAAPAAGKKMAMGGSVRDMEMRWEEAIAKHDIATVESMIADDFIGVTSKNKVVGRRALLSEMKSDKDTYTSAKIERLETRNFGKDVTVTTGIAREKGTGKDGKAFDRVYRFTDTWMNRGGKWQCVAAQVTLVKGK